MADYKKPSEKFVLSGEFWFGSNCCLNWNRVKIEGLTICNPNMQEYSDSLAEWQTGLAYVMRYEDFYVATNGDYKGMTLSSSEKADMIEYLERNHLACLVNESGVFIVTKDKELASKVQKFLNEAMYKITSSGLEISLS